MTASASSASPAFYSDLIGNTMYFYPAIRYNDINHLQNCVGIEGEVYEVVFHHGESLGATGVYKITISEDAPYEVKDNLFKKLKKAFVKTYYPHKMSSFALEKQLEKIVDEAMLLPRQNVNPRDKEHKKLIESNNQYYFDCRNYLSKIQYENEQYLCRIDDIGEKHYKEDLWNERMAEIE
jgi:hypothetical protein